MPAENNVTYPIDKNAPPSAAKAPLIVKAIYLTLLTLIPTDSAASGLSPTALILSPNFVYLNIIQTNSTNINATYVNILCPDNIFPITGIFSIIGIFILGKTNEFKEVDAPLSPVNKYKPNTVIPDAIKFKDIPDIIIFDFNLRAK